MTSSAPARAKEADPRRWRALGVCLIAGFMTLLDVSIVNVALPSIDAGLDASASDLQWILSGYALAFGLALVPSGRLGDARGRRRMFLLGLAVFTAASALCGLAPTSELLVAARLLQGVGGGMLVPQNSALIQQLFSGAERGKAFGLLGGSIGLSTAVGPLLGGVILVTVPGEDAWRWVFLVNVPVGLAALPLAARFVPGDLPTREREPLDPVGIVLLGAGLTLLLLPLLQGGQGAPALLWLAAPAGAAVLVGFVAWERRYGRRGLTPLVDLRLFRQRSYALGTAIGASYFAGFTSIFFVLTLFLQQGLGLTPLQAGLVQTPFALGGAVAATVAGRAVTRVGRRMVVAGAALTVVGLLGSLAAVELVDGTGAAWVLTAPLLVAGVGSGLTISPNVTLTLAEVPVAGAGSAGGVLQTAQRVGTALGIAVVGAVFFAVLDGNRWQQALSAGLGLAAAFVAVSLGLAVADVRSQGIRDTRPRGQSPDR